MYCESPQTVGCLPIWTSGEVRNIINTPPVIQVTEKHSSELQDNWGNRAVLFFAESCRFILGSGPGTSSSVRPRTQFRRSSCPRSRRPASPSGHYAGGRCFSRLGSIFAFPLQEFLLCFQVLTNVLIFLYETVYYWQAAPYYTVLFTAHVVSATQAKKWRISPRCPGCQRIFTLCD